MPRKTNQPAANTELDLEPAITVEAVVTDADTLIEQPTDLAAADNTVTLMPDPAAPAINAGEPDVSFKIDYADRTQWYASEDGGKTKEGIGEPFICGSPIDLVLQISKATWGDGSDFDQRLRLAFQLPDDQGIGELNINATNATKTGEHYVTSPARSLLGGLLAISEAAEDMEAFTRMARFTIRPGRGKGVFIDVDIACNGRWVAMSSAGRTNQIAKDPAGFHSQLALLKSRFRSESLLLTAGAIVGDIASYDNAMRLLQAAD